MNAFEIVRQMEESYGQGYFVGRNRGLVIGLIIGLIIGFLIHRIF